MTLDIIRDRVLLVLKLYDKINPEKVSWILLASWGGGGRLIVPASGYSVSDSYHVHKLLCDFMCDCNKNPASIPRSLIDTSLSKPVKLLGEARLPPYRPLTPSFCAFSADCGLAFRQ